MHAVQQHRLAVVEVERPATFADAVELMAAYGPRARAVAGGTDLLLELQRNGRPGVDVLIDLSRLAEISTITEDSGWTVIGAGVTHAQVVTSSVVRRTALPLAQASAEVGSPQLRNRATIAGNLVTASPANDTITPLRALDAVLRLVSVRGEREVALADFHTGVRHTVLESDELVHSIRLRQMAPNERAVFAKLGNRRSQAISVIHLTALVEFAGSDVVAARLLVGSVAPTIVELESATALVGTSLESAAIRGVARSASREIRPIDDVRATADYRSDALATLVQRSLEALKSPPSLPHDPVTLTTRPKRADDTARAYSSSTEVAATVNGQPISAPGAANRTLLDWLRDMAGPVSGGSLTGSKEGCAEGECGACTVWLDGAAVVSCLVPATAADGADVTTIEGLAEDGRLHPLQRSFVARGAVQCGFCIPGFIMAGAKLLEEHTRPTRHQTETAFSGNLCRCTGYYRMFEAIEDAAEAGL